MEDAENNEINTANLTATEKRELFLAVLSASCNVTKACEVSGLDRGNAYTLKAKDDAFSERWDQAKELGVEALEDEMHRRAVDGTVQITKYGVNRQYSDVLAIFLAKAHKPERYSERIRNEITGAGGAALNLDDGKIALKLNAILNNVMKRKDTAEEPQAVSDDFDDLC